MKANELRLGNLVSFRGTPICIDTNYDLFTALVHISRNGERYKPILLTEEWLLKFGFTKVESKDKDWDFGIDYDLFVNQDIIISYADDFSCGLYGDKDKDQISVIPKWNQINTVHGLQNLYFALTGEELAFKKEEP